MAGDHKCPLCSATFTRPQHVGRHLRAHTGDRPYECKECPLRFARSDLLSRHVNKAHKPPDEDGKPPVKKGRRKSMPTTSSKPPPPAVGKTPGKPQPNAAAAKARRASFDVPPGPSNPQPPPLQAQSMYPHHPLLAGTPQASDQIWSSPTSSVGLNNMVPPNYSQSFSSSMAGMVENPYAGNGMINFQPPFTAVPMRISGSDQGVGTSPMGRNGSLGGMSGMGYDFGFKKRACDQCNHSKVRCDFSEPCHRCTHRNLRCTYNKPPKSRTIATLPGQRMSLPMSSSTSNMTTSLSGSSTSPQSHFSSPHSNPSPSTSTMPPPIHASSTPHAPYPSQVAYVQNNPSQWSQNTQWANSNAPMVDPSYGVLQQSPQAAMFSSPSQLGQYSALSPTQSIANSSLPVPLPHRNSASSASSPHRHLAPTPSLTSNSTSPPGTDEPSERRTSNVSFTGAYGSEPNIHSLDSNSSLSETVLGLHGKYSPTSMSVPVRISPAHSMQPEFVNPFAWAPPQSATIDPRTQFRSSLASEDDTTTDHTSRPSTASTFFENVDDNTAHGLNQRRRSSAGVWANAFNQMTLQDQSIPLPEAYASGQASQQFAARRPTFPTINSISEDLGTTKVPSLSDVKDLWKLFMSEPITGTQMPIYPNPESQTLTQAPNTFVPAAPVPITPRPGITRGLSRSNSMPSLTSPPLLGQSSFFSNFNGATPRPVQPQQSYTHTQDPTEGNPEDPTTMRKWKDSIKNRQQSFEFDVNVEHKLKATSPPSMNAAPPPTTMSNAHPSNGMLPPHLVDLLPHNGVRPMASVLQHSVALQQTLAPERTPSFGTDNMPTPTRNTNFYLGGKPTSKLTSALARPGNKRLASQTLVPNDTGKKLVGDMWDEGEEEDDPAKYGGVRPPAGAELFGMPQGLAPNHMAPPGAGLPNTAIPSAFFGSWQHQQQATGQAPAS